MTPTEKGSLHGCKESQSVREDDEGKDGCCSGKGQGQDASRHEEEGLLMASRVWKKLRIAINQRKKPSGTAPVEVPPEVVSDVTPNAVDWLPSGGANPATSAMLQITGITVPITLRVSFTHGVNAFDHRYSVQSTASFGTGTPVNNNDTLTISNGQYLGFQSGSMGGTVATFWTITNVSNGNALIDTLQTTAVVMVSEE